VIPAWQAFDLPDISPENEQGLHILEASVIELLRRIDTLFMAVHKVAPDHDCEALEQLARLALLQASRLGLLSSQQPAPRDVAEVLDAVRQGAEDAAVLRTRILESLPADRIARALEAETRLVVSDDTIRKRYDITKVFGHSPGLADGLIDPELVDFLLAERDRLMEVFVAKKKTEAEARILPSRQGLRGLLRLLPVQWLDSLVAFHELPYDGRRTEREKRLTAHLTDADVLWQLVFEDLPDDALDLLAFLLELGGSVPITRCSKRFGADGDGRYLWGIAPPGSRLGHLRAVGLAFVATEEHGKRGRRSVVVPRELREPLARVLQELSEEDGELILERVRSWIKSRTEELESTSAWKALGSNTRDDIRFVADVLGELMLVYQGETPRLWSQEGLVSCCLEDFPRKVTADEDFFERLPQVLDSLLAGLGELGHLPQSNALREGLSEIADEIPRGSRDRSVWGPAKTLAMAAEEARVDVEDRDALQAFIAGFNRRLPKPGPAAMPVHTTKVGRNQPCPCGSGKKFKRCCGR